MRHSLCQHGLACREREDSARSALIMYSASAAFREARGAAQAQLCALLKQQASITSIDHSREGRSALRQDEAHICAGVSCPNVSRDKDHDPKYDQP